LPEQDACLESAAATMAASKNAAKQDLDATLEKCRTMPNVDVVNECVNDAFSVFETATRNASKVYKADVQSCL
jgi:hypothetical protein